MKFEDDRIFVFCLALLFVIVGCVSLVIAEFTPQIIPQSVAEEQRVSDETWAAIWITQQQQLQQQLLQQQFGYR